MAVCRIPDLKVGGSNLSGVIFFATRSDARSVFVCSTAVVPLRDRCGSMAEWLMRLIRNKLGVARGISNLSAVGRVFLLRALVFLFKGQKLLQTARVVMTPASHAGGSEFDPRHAYHLFCIFASRRNAKVYFFCKRAAKFPCRKNVSLEGLEPPIS